MTPEETEALVLELEYQIKDLARQMAIIARVLAPFYARRDSIQVEVAYTHHHEESKKDFRVFVTGFKRDGRERRRELFAELDRIHASSAPERTAQKELRAELNAAGRKLAIILADKKRKK